MSCDVCSGEGERCAQWPLRAAFCVALCWAVRYLCTPVSCVLCSGVCSVWSFSVVFLAVDVVHVSVTALDGRLRVDVDRNAIAATIFALFTHLDTPAARSALGHCLSQSARSISENGAYWMWTCMDATATTGAPPRPVEDS